MPRALILTAITTVLGLALLAPAAALAQQAGPTLEQVKNATYPVDVAPGGSAKLVDGKFEVAAAPGSARSPASPLPPSCSRRAAAGAARSTTSTRWMRRTSRWQGPASAIASGCG